jgi:hypothetical protein
VLPLVKSSYHQYLKDIKHLLQRFSFLGSIQVLLHILPGARSKVNQLKVLFLLLLRKMTGEPRDIFMFFAGCDVR